MKESVLAGDQQYVPKKRQQSEPICQSEPPRFTHSSEDLPKSEVPQNMQATWHPSGSPGCRSPWPSKLAPEKGPKDWGPPEMEPVWQLVEV